MKLLDEKSKSIPDTDIMFDSMRVITMEAEEKSDALAKSFTEGKQVSKLFGSWQILGN